MSDTQTQEAARLAALLDAEQVRTVDADVMHSQAAALLRSQAEQIEQLRAELARMREPLSDEQIDKLKWGPHEGNPITFAEGLRDFARAVEAAHGITAPVIREKQA